MRSTVFAAFAFLALIAPASAESVLYILEFDPSTGRDWPFVPESLPIGIDATELTGNVGAIYSPGHGAQGYIFAEFDPLYAGAIEFTVMPWAGYSLDLMSFSFDGLAGQEENRARRVEVSTSLDDFASPILTVDTTADERGHTYGLALTSYVSGPITFRLTAFWEPGDRLRAYVIDNIRLDFKLRMGTVPEPASIGLAASAAALLAGVAKRRQSR